MRKSGTTRKAPVMLLRAGMRCLYFTLALGVCYLTGLMMTTTKTRDDTSGHHLRLLQETGNLQNTGTETPTTASNMTYEQSCATTGYPNAYEPIGQGWLTCDALAGGGFMLLILGMLYTFLALAIIVDEFFVPALEIMTQRLNVSDDVAGATLMAAGGSAPELFTSFLGVFITKSDVGFGTIVGSAVFNVLFVIAMCALFSTEVLTLTPWPLARDCAYYTLSLGTLAIFFSFFRDASVDAKYQIMWWEALVLLLMYVGYVVLMSYNERLHIWVLSHVRKKNDNEIDDRSCLSGDVALEDQEDQDPREDTTTTAFTKLEKEKKLETKAHSNSDPCLPPPRKRSSPRPRRSSMTTSGQLRYPTHFRSGVLQILLSEHTMLETAAAHCIANVPGDARDVFRHMASTGTSKDTINFDEFLEMLREGLGADPTDEQALEAFATIDVDGNGLIREDEFCSWYDTSETRLAAEADRAFGLMDTDKNGSVSADELESVLRIVGYFSGDVHPNESLAELMSELDLNGDGLISKAEFDAWYRESVFFQNRVRELKMNRMSVEVSILEEEPASAMDRIFMRWPRGKASGFTKLNYIVTFPLMVLFFSHIPNVTLKSQEHWYGLTFVLAIMWIGIFSYFMVWFAETFGYVFGIPPEVMGLTFLAAGTSIPDLLSSVIVARQGKGDMAVSSSIGSNIFDILVGLPLPWFLSTLIRGAPQSVKSQSLGLSVLILLLMIFLVIGTIHLSKWKLTKSLAGVMLILYGVFLAQDLARVDFSK